MSFRYDSIITGIDISRVLCVYEQTWNEIGADCLLTAPQDYVKTVRICSFVEIYKGTIKLSTISSYRLQPCHVVLKQTNLHLFDRYISSWYFYLPIYK